MGTGLRWVGARGLAMIGCAVLSGAVLNWPQVTFTRWRYAGGQTIYPWWTWLLIAAVAAAGAVLVVAPESAAGRRWRCGAAGVALVAGAELAGTGAVAARHWKPAQGMGGYPGETRILAALAAFLAVTALVAVAVAVAQLTIDRALRRSAGATRAAVPVVVGGAVIAVLPLLMVEGHGRTLTSWGAVGLIYAGPWGVAIAASAWLERTAAAGVLVTVAICSALAAIGPQMTDLLLADDLRLAVAGLAGAVLAAGVLWRDGGADPRGRTWR